MTAPVHQYSNEERRKRIFAIVGASSGNLVEWFDFYVYAFCAIYFAPAFFPSDNPTVQLLNTAGVFAAGFLMRPIGGWMFGRIADKHGRKTAMLISVVMMCAGSLAIACMPTYASIGTLVLRSDTPLDLERLSEFMDDLLQWHGNSLLRYKGVLNIADEPRRLVFQGVLRLYGFDWDSEWRDDEARESVIVFIGDNLPEDSIREGFERIVEGR